MVIYKHMSIKQCIQCASNKSSKWYDGPTCRSCYDKKRIEKYSIESHYKELKRQQSIRYRSKHCKKSTRIKNGVRDDNRIENLELWSTHQPSGQRLEDKLAYAKEIIALYDAALSPIA